MTRRPPIIERPSKTGYNCKKSVDIEGQQHHKAT